MKKAFTPHIAIIRESIAAIESYRPVDKESFLASPVLQDAVLMRLQVVGEHLARIRRIDEDHFDAVAGQNWYHVIGLRNIISHGYETIDMEQIWKIISTEISLLDASLDILGGD